MSSSKDCKVCSGTGVIRERVISELYRTEQLVAKPCVCKIKDSFIERTKELHDNLAYKTSKDGKEKIDSGIVKRILFGKNVFLSSDEGIARRYFMSALAESFNFEKGSIDNIPDFSIFNDSEYYAYFTNGVDFPSKIKEFTPGNPKLMIFFIGVWAPHKQMDYYLNAFASFIRDHISKGGFCWIAYISNNPFGEYAVVYDKNSQNGENRVVVRNPYWSEVLDKSLSEYAFERLDIKKYDRDILERLSTHSRSLVKEENQIKTPKNNPDVGKAGRFDPTNVRP